MSSPGDAVEHRSRSLQAMTSIGLVGVGHGTRVARLNGKAPALDRGHGGRGGAWIRAERAFVASALTIEGGGVRFAEACRCRALLLAGPEENG